MTQPRESSNFDYQSIVENCRSGSWFAVRPALQQLQSAADVGPGLLCDLLGNLISASSARSRSEGERLLRLLSQNFWHINVPSGNGARRSLIVHCAGASWVLGLLVHPQLHIETVRRQETGATA